jgi:microcystin-dependent protein
MTKKTLLGLAAGATALCSVGQAHAQDLYMGQTLLVGFTFCPRGTLEADGTLLPISQYDALFALLGTTYGGDGVVNFALPDLRGRVANSWGQGPGLSNYVQGETGGTQSVTLTTSQMPSHTHIGYSIGTTAAPNTDNPTNAVPADYPSAQVVYNNSVAPSAIMAPNTMMVGAAGAGIPFSNLGPYLTLRYCVVTEGIYPPHS